MIVVLLSSYGWSHFREIPNTRLSNVDSYTTVYTLLFSNPETMATLVKYTCKSFIKLTPGVSIQ